MVEIVTEDPISALIDHWRSTGARLNPPATEVQISEFERKHGIALPESVRALYLAANGMAEDSADSRWFAFWSLAAIERESGVQRFSGAEHEIVRVVFADGMIHSQYYALHVSGPLAGVVSVVWDTSSGEDTPEWGSLAAFAARYPDEGAPGLPRATAA